MPAAHNAAIAIENLADAGTIAATTFAPLTPPFLMQNHHVARKWRSLTNNESVIVDLGSVKSIDTVALFGLNLTSAGITRVRASETDSAVQSDLNYDSSALPNRVDPNYQSLIVLISSLIDARYVRIDLNDASLAYIEAGRAVVSQRYQFESNFAYGWSRSYVDRSRRVVSRGGQTHIDKDRTYRRVECAFDQLLESERNGFIEQMDRVNGYSADVLFITRSDSTNLGRDSIWGLPVDVSAVSQPSDAMDGDEAIFTKPFAIEERL